MPAAHRLSARGAARPLGVTSTSWAAKRTSTSPSSQRITSLLVRSITRAGDRPVGSALVLSVVRVLLWIKSGSLVAAGMAWRVFMAMQSRQASLEAPARPAAASCTRRNLLHGAGTMCTKLQGAAT